MNNLSSKLDVTQVLEVAEALYLQFANSVNIPDLLAELASSPPPPPAAAAAEPDVAASNGPDLSWVELSNT